MGRKDGKIILLNASNMESFPVYPYAFIQVPAIARQYGIEVVCKDLLGFAEENWGEILEHLIAHHQPDLIMVTLRNTDTLTATDYEKSGDIAEESIPYFPIERTKTLISKIREISGLKIVVGGFAFSVFPEELMNYLRPDYGIFGGPDDFFKRYSNILSGKLENVSNLIYFKDENLISNSRIYFPPFKGIEYTPKVINEMMDFYESFPDPGFFGAPIEINRGCIYDCVFCSEPLVKGNQVQHREIASIMKDIEMLFDHGIRKFYMITSELNPEGNDFILSLAEAITEFNSKLNIEKKITWFGANYLLNFSVDEFRQLYASGFTGGWFDVTALDDDNAREMRTPYRNRSVIKALKDYSQVKSEIDSSDDISEDLDPGIFWTMFLGNPAVRIETIRDTLKTANEEGISQLYDSCGLNTHIRVFDYEEPSEDTLRVTYSIDEELKRKKYDQLLPSFAYPPALLKGFSVEELTELFKYLGETYLSTKYATTRDWQGFFANHTDSKQISEWFQAIAQHEDNHPNEQLLKKINNTELGQGVMVESSIQEKSQLHESEFLEITKMFLSFSFRNFPEYFESVGLPYSEVDLHQSTPFNIARSIYSKWSTEEELQNWIVTQSLSYSPGWKQSLLQFCAQTILYKFNIEFNIKYAPFFV